jgi:hypothetical protein
LKYLLSVEAFKKHPVERYMREPAELKLVYDALCAFMVKHGRDTSAEELEVFFLSLHPGLTDKEKELYHVVFSNIASTEVKADVVEGLIQSLERRQSLLNLAVSAYEAAEGRKDVSDFNDELKLLAQKGTAGLETEASNEITFVTDDLDVIYTKTVKEPGLRWRLKSLNQSLGSLRKGDFGFVVARPETGKTTFLASECSFMASQAGGPVLWLNNEEQGEKVMLRCYQAALGAPLEKLFSNIKGSKEDFQKVTGGRLKLLDAVSLGKREVEDICKQVAPALIVFDQIDKIKGFTSDRDDLVLGAIYQWARELAKTYCPVIGICQADGTAEGVRWLTMAHVANAKTSKQAEADWILGIGRSNDPGYEMVRHFHVSKNKLVGDEDTLPDMRHGNWDVLIEPSIARYRDIVA